jgi:hypothetical protein
VISVYVGDMHCVVEEIDECWNLIQGVLAFCIKVDADQVVFLGDQHHAHSTVRLEVMAFWRKVFALFAEHEIAVVALVGNHDLSNDRATDAMVHYPEIVSVRQPHSRGGILYLPYIHDPKEFLAACRACPEARTVVCHQLFDGSRYENGFYVGEDGVDPTLLPQPAVISGHIHKPQRVGKVWYLGAPRWRIATDANEDRAVWAVEHDVDGNAVRARAMDTAPYCRRIVHLQDTPEAPADVPVPGPLLDVRVDVTGPAAYVRARGDELEGRGVRVRTFRNDQSTLVVKESEGLQVAWRKFRQSFVPSRGTPGDRVAVVAAERFGLAA